MKKTVRCICLTLTLCMLLSMLPIGVSAATKRTVRLDSSVTNGTLYINGSNAKSSVTVESGTTVTVTVKPNSGYAMRGGSLAIRYTKSGRSYTEYPKTWTFTMPNANVTISCEFYAFSKNNIDGIRLGDIEQLYSDANLPITMDAPISEFWRGNESTGVGETYYMAVNPPRHRFYTGNPKTFLQDGQVSASYTLTNGSNTGIVDRNGHYLPEGKNDAGAYSGLWMMNIYDPAPEYDSTGNMRLALCHREDYTTGYYFAFGVAVSMDQGKTWTYLGDSVAPTSNNHASVSSNIAGHPYIITKEQRFESSDFVKASNTAYSVTVDTIAVGDVSTLVTVTFYNADGSVFGTATDSVESYIARQTDASIVAVGTAILKFGASAKAYFLSKQ